MSDIYKLCFLNNNIIEKINVYNNDTRINENITELYKSDINNNTILDNMFTESEIKNIIENNIPVYFQNSYIYKDDTIETIKKYIIQTENIAFETLYLFCSYKEQLNANNIYDN